VDTAAAEIGWRRLPVEDLDVLAVGAQDVGRGIGYRHGMFEYQSFAGGHRTILATTSTAAAARRLLVAEAAAIARMRRRQQPVHLRVRGPAVDFTVTKGQPSSWWRDTASGPGSPSVRSASSGPWSSPTARMRRWRTSSPAIATRTAPRCSPRVADARRRHLCFVAGPWVDSSGL